MAPIYVSDNLPQLNRRVAPTGTAENDPVDWRAAARKHPEDLVLESWSQGFLVGALLVMACITIANMRKGVLLHKLILLELLLAMSHGTFCFMTFDGYGWYLSATASLMYLSWIIHNVVAWMKVKPFFTQPGGFFQAKTGIWVRGVYLGTLALTIPVILFQITDNFRFFNNHGGWYRKVRPYEPFFRDPWWIFTCLVLFHVVRKCYGTGVLGLIQRSPRFGIMLIAIILSIVFTILDIVASIHSFIGTTDGINPWWKLSLVFKCLTDTIMLDDFKTELKRLGIKRIEKEEVRRNSVALVTEYPSGLEGSDASAYSRPRRDVLFRYFHSPTHTHTKALSSASTMLNLTPDARDNDEDPLSEYAAQREERESRSKQRQRSLNNPNANLEEVEFATALSLDPSRVSGVESPDPNHRLNERANIRSTTKKISKLPGLSDLRFQAIRPGKKVRRQGYSHAHESDLEESDSDDDDNRSDAENSTQCRNMAEEIQRTTIMALEAQRRARENASRSNSSQGSSSISALTSAPGSVDEEEANERDDYVQSPTSPHRIAQRREWENSRNSRYIRVPHDDGTEEAEAARRERWLRGSIGAAE